MKIHNINDLPIKPGNLSACKARFENIAANIGDYKQWFEKGTDGNYYLFNSAVGYTGFYFDIRTNEID